MDSKRLYRLTAELTPAGNSVEERAFFDTQRWCYDVTRNACRPTEYKFFTGPDVTLDSAVYPGDCHLDNRFCNLCASTDNQGTVGRSNVS